MSTRTEAVERISVALAELQALAETEAGLAIGVPFADLDDGDLLETVAAVGQVIQAGQRALAQLAGVVDHRSPAARGNVSLAKREGFSSATALMVSLTGLAPATIARCVRVGSATHQRHDFKTGGLLPARHQYIADALASDQLSVEAADEISSALDRAARGGSLDEHRRMEAHLVELAPRLSLTELRTICLKGADVLDPDGIEPREQRQRDDRSLTINRLGSGMTKFTWLLPPAQAAIVVTGIHTLARQIDTGPQPEAASLWQPLQDQIDPNRIADGCTPATASYDSSGRPIGWAARAWAQKLSDAAFAFFDHATKCADTGLGAPRIHMVVRVALDTLIGGDGHASIDGGGSMSAGEARRLAATAGIIPAVLGSNSELLDLGREQRFFSRKQRIALMERDGACAWPGCGTLPGWSDAHHIRWWEHDSGPTDIANGVMLCSSHHHRIHDNGWTVEVRPPDSDPNSPPIPHFIAPATAHAAHHFPGALIDTTGRVTLRSSRTTWALAS